MLSWILAFVFDCCFLFGALSIGPDVPHCITDVMIVASTLFYFNTKHVRYDLEKKAKLLKISYDDK
jgi:hypothetical protein